MLNMKEINFKILLILLLFSVITFISRILPVFFFPDDSSLHIIRADAEYNLRQIEVMVHNYLQYDWFDPMTAYPYGKDIGWGPLFPMIAGAFAIIMGASQQGDIINTAAFVTPLMAAAMVPVIYFTAKVFDKRKFTAIAAAAIIPFISLFFLNYTSYGYVDHHAAEILFSSIFCLFYVLAVGTPLNSRITDFKDEAFVKITVYSVLAGFAYCACYFTSPTTVLFLVILSVFTFFSCIMTHSSGKIPVKEGYVNTISLIIPVVLISLFGVRYDGFALSSYTLVHAIIPLSIILATGAMVIISALLKRSAFADNKYAYPLVLVFFGIICVFVSGIVVPEIFGTLFSGANLIFGFENVAIAEMQPWNLDYAIQSYHFALILALGGLLIAAYDLYSKRQNNLLFLLIWTIVTLYATIRHLRFEYFVAAPFSVLSAICISYVYDNYYHSFSDYIHKFTSGEETPGKKGKKKKAGIKKENTSGAFIFIFVAIISILFFANSIISDIAFAEDYAGVSFEKDKWIEGMEWMNENTPDPGVDYFGEYSGDTFVYPGNSYGVMCWWDFGHVVTLIGKRIPTSNPFQDNVVGDTGCANFFISGTETGANRIMDQSGARFVVTNSELATPVKGIMTILSWLSEQNRINDYIISVPDESGHSQEKYGYTSDYYNTMVVRLQNLDGTYIEPSPVSDFSTDPKEPNSIISALKNYRLVYESPDPDDNIKIYEYVDGCEVSGEGTVELEIVTNTGREFVYRQKSENGMFVLPYSTINNPYDVKANGQYHILETDEYFDVSEEKIGSIY